MKIPLRRERIRADEGVERLGVADVGDNDAAGETPWRGKVREPSLSCRRR